MAVGVADALGCLGGLNTPRVTGQGGKRSSNLIRASIERNERLRLNRLLSTCEISAVPAHSVRQVQPFVSSPCLKSNRPLSSRSRSSIELRKNVLSASGSGFQTTWQSILNRNPTSRRNRCTTRIRSEQASTNGERETAHEEEETNGEGDSLRGSLDEPPMPPQDDNSLPQSPGESFLRELEDNQVGTAQATAILIGQDPVSAAEAAAAEAAAGTFPAPSELEAPASVIGPGLARIYASCQTYMWRDYKVNYTKQGSGPAILLVHGFGASIGHWRKNIPVLAESHTVFAIDLLGQGASEKPQKYVYTIEGWAELIVDFLKDVVGEPAVLVGNSIGSLAALLASAEAPAGAVRGTVLLNCAGGMNNKAVTDDWRIRVALPLFWLIDWLLLQPSVARSLFNRVKGRENVKTVLQSVYSNKAAVDDELVEVILGPAEDEGALDAFVAIITGPPGPRPEQLVPKIQHPILLLWGDEDPFTPFDGPIGRYFRSLPTTTPTIEFVEMRAVGHCPHDDKPELVHASLLPWLAKLETPTIAVAS